MPSHHHTIITMDRCLLLVIDESWARALPWRLCTLLLARGGWHGLPRAAATRRHRRHHRRRRRRPR